MTGTNLKKYLDIHEEVSDALNEAGSAVRKASFPQRWR